MFIKESCLSSKWAKLNFPFLPPNKRTTKNQFLQVFAKWSFKQGLARSYKKIFHLVITLARSCLLKRCKMLLGFTKLTCKNRFLGLLAKFLREIFEKLEKMIALLRPM